MTTAPEQNLVPIFVYGWRCVRLCTALVYGVHRGVHKPIAGIMEMY
ncbi:MAG: hypothetical protein IKE29_19745 [Paenibacillus sp.]|nr:hypothetical protein [Paenibacillus sp.]MBR2566829.1 hypothetical protein [Paenibacillus sp.]